MSFIPSKLSLNFESTRLAVMYPRFRCAGYEADYVREQQLVEERAAEALKKREEEINAPVDSKAITALTNILDRVSDRDGDLNGELEWLKNEIPLDPFVGSHYTIGISY